MFWLFNIMGHGEEFRKGMGIFQMGDNCLNNFSDVVTVELQTQC